MKLLLKIFEGKNIYTGKAKVHPDDVNFLLLIELVLILLNAVLELNDTIKKQENIKETLNKLLKKIKILESAETIILEEEIMLTDFYEYLY